MCDFPIIISTLILNWRFIVDEQNKDSLRETETTRTSNYTLDDSSDEAKTESAPYSDFDNDLNRDPKQSLLNIN